MPVPGRSQVALQALAGVHIPDFLHRAAGRQFAALRRHLRGLFGHGDHSLVGSVVVQALLGRGRVFLVNGERRRGVYEVAIGGRTFTVDFFADEVGAGGPLAIDPRGDLYLELREFFPQHLTLEEWDRIEHARFDRESANDMALLAKLLRLRRASGLTRPRTPQVPGSSVRHPS